MMSIGNMESGKRKMLNSDRETKAVLASRMLFLSLRTNVAKVASDTWNQNEKENYITQPKTM